MIGFTTEVSLVGASQAHALCLASAAVQDLHHLYQDDHHESVVKAVSDIHDHSSTTYIANAESEADHQLPSLTDMMIFEYVHIVDAVPVRYQVVESKVVHDG